MAILDLSTQAGRDAANARDRSYNSDNGLSGTSTAGPSGGSSRSKKKTPAIAVPSTSTVGSPASFTADQQSAQDWINKQESGQGGLDAYIKRQQQRYSDAYTSGDQDLIGRLNSDSQRVGYTLGASAPQAAMSSAAGNQVAQPASAINPDLIQKQKTDLINSQISQQIQGFNQGLAQMQQANESAVGQNNQFLQDQISRMQKQKPVDEQAAINLANRRGGFYSGGLDYQLGQNNKAYVEQQGQLERDTATRNADIWNRNSLLAQQAAEKITALQNQSPALIQQAVQEELDRQRGYARQDSADARSEKALQLQESGQSFNQNLATRDQQLKEQKTAWDMSANNPQVQSQLITNEINKLKLANLPTEQQYQLVQMEQELAKGDIGLATAQYQLQQLQDPNSPVNVKQRLQNDMLQVEAQNLPQEQQLKLEQLKKQIAEIGKAPYRSPQQVEMDQVKLEAAREELTNLRTGGSKQPQTAENYSKYIDSVAKYVKDPSTGATQLGNAQEVESAILMSNLPEYEQYKLYKSNGLKWDGPIPEKK